MRIAKIIASSYVDGPGQRTVLFMQGCTLGCRGCQSRHLWAVDGGREEEPLEIAKTLADLSRANGGNVTISGGEPLLQFNELLALVGHLRRLGVKHIIVYTGVTFYKLAESFRAAGPSVFFSLLQLLENINILVDGPFIKELDSDFVTYRGSANQLPIDTWATIENGLTPVVADWDSEIQITEAGDLVAPVGLAMEFSGAGEVGETRMCGQSR